MGKGDFVFAKVYGVERNPRFTKPASGVEADLEGYLHPVLRAMPDGFRQSLGRSIPDFSPAYLGGF